jgi:hypothetical protein
LEDCAALAASTTLAFSTNENTDFEMRMSMTKYGALTFGFGFPLRNRGLALGTDLCKAGQVGLSLVGLSLGMQLVNG